MIGLSRHVTDWATLSLVEGRMPYLIRKKRCNYNDYIAFFKDAIKKTTLQTYARNVNTDEFLPMWLKSIDWKYLLK